MVLRNGIWTTDKTQHFVLQGLYFSNPGDLFLIANPLHSRQYVVIFSHATSCLEVSRFYPSFLSSFLHSTPVIQDFMLKLKNESTVHDVIAQAANIPKQIACMHISLTELIDLLTSKCLLSQQCHDKRSKPMLLPNTL